METGAPKNVSRTRVCTAGWRYRPDVASLRPARAPETERPYGAGYRLYHDEDLVWLEQIVALKFIGFPLKRIKQLLDGKRPDIAGTLRIQRRFIEEKRRHLDQAIQAITGAERLAESKRQPDWDVFKKIIEVIEMRNDMDWVKRYYTEEQLADLAARDRANPEIRENAEREWPVLIKEVQASLGEDPAGEKAQALAARWTKLIEGFTGGDPGLAANLRQLYTDQANWPASFQKPFSSETQTFIAKAIAVRKTR